MRWSRPDKYKQSSRDGELRRGMWLCGERTQSNTELGSWGRSAAGQFSGREWKLELVADISLPSLPVSIVGRYVFLWSHKARGECQERSETIPDW